MGIRMVAAAIPFLFVTPCTGAAGDYSSPYGDWRGQAQFHGRVGRTDDSKAQSVTELVISIDPQGKLVGSSAGNGCHALGLATPSGPATVINLDVTFSGCSYAGYNRRFSGNLFLYPRNSYASLRLRSLVANTGPKPGSYDIRATLKR